MAAATAPQSNISRALGIVSTLLEFAPTIGPAITVGKALITDIGAAVAAGQDIDPAKLVPGELLTAELIGQLQNDVKGIGGPAQQI
jgi:hypothetical protein